jgi:hypothetical protein
MWRISPPRLILSLALGLVLALLGRAGAADDPKDDKAKKDKDSDKFERVKFDTADGVELHGSYYASSKGTKSACVLLVHNFDAKKGGSSSQDGWGHVAEELQAKGFAVLSLDLRGFGDSKSINPADFWKYRHNQQYVKGYNPGSTKPKTTIDHTDFNSAYYPHLVNDLAAAKTFLDRKNDAKELNSSNLIVIAAGEGATLSAMWMASEWKRFKGVANPILRLEPQPEGRDQVCGIFLTISPSLAGQRVPVKDWLKEVGKDHKVPLAFLYGKDDTSADRLALSYLKEIKPGYVRDKEPKKDAKKDLPFTGEHDIKDTKLAGSQLLTKTLDTESWIIKSYLEPLMDKHGIDERRERDVEKSLYFWTFNSRPTPAQNNLMKLTIPVEMMGVR